MWILGSNSGDQAWQQHFSLLNHLTTFNHFILKMIEVRFGRINNVAKVHSSVAELLELGPHRGGPHQGAPLGMTHLGGTVCEQWHFSLRRIKPSQRHGNE